MISRRTLIAASIALAALPALAQTMKAADVHPAGYPTVVAVEAMGRNLDAATQGRIKLQMYPGPVLGDAKTLIEQARVGAIPILRTALGPVDLRGQQTCLMGNTPVFEATAPVRAECGARFTGLMKRIEALK